MEVEGEDLLVEIERLLEALVGLVHRGEPVEGLQVLAREVAVAHGVGELLERQREHPPLPEDLAQDRGGPGEVRVLRAHLLKDLDRLVVVAVAVVDLAGAQVLLRLGQQVRLPRRVTRQRPALGGLAVEAGALVVLRRPFPVVDAAEHLRRLGEFLLLLVTGARLLVLLEHPVEVASGHLLARSLEALGGLLILAAIAMVFRHHP